MGLKQEYAEKTKLAEDITNYFENHDPENALKEVVNKIPFIFPSPENISIRINFGKLQYVSREFTETNLLLEEKIPIYDNTQELQFEICSNIDEQNDDLIFEKSLIHLLFRNIGIQIEYYGLHQLKDSFRRIFENSPDEMFIHDPDGKILDVNKKVCTKLGYSKEDLGRQPSEYFSAEEYKKVVRQKFKQVIKEGKARFESVQITKSGESIPVEINATTGKIRGKTVIFSTVRDISERKRKDKLILKAYTYLSNAVKTGNIHFWEIDVESGKIGVDFGRDNFGYFTYGFAQEFNDFSELVHPDDRNSFHEKIRGCVEDETYLCQSIHRGLAENGWEWFQSTGYVAEKNDKGKPCKINGLSININDKENAEQEMKNAYMRLQNAMRVENLWWWELEFPDWKMNIDINMLRQFGYRQEKLDDFSFNDFLELVHPDDRQKLCDNIFACVKNGYKCNPMEFRADMGDGKWTWHAESARVAEFDSKGIPLKIIGVVKNINDRKINEIHLVEAKIEAEAANRTKAEFLATMSHELRTPLNSVIGFSQILLNQKFGEINDKQEKYIHNILKSGTHLLYLINDILEIAKIESGKTALLRKNVDLREIIADMEEHIHPEIMIGKRKLEIVIDNDLPYIYADKSKIKRIFHNLLSNAVKFTDESGIIKIAVKKDPQNIIVSVSDNGIGIPKSQYENIFLPFKQLHEYKNRRYSGSGLGLALVKEMVELHGGSIWVESEPEKGSTFTFTLPIMPADIPESGSNIYSGGREGI